MTPHGISLGTLFLVALIVRLIFAFLVFPALPGTFDYVHPDTLTYLRAFLNLVQEGKYCFDLEIRDSCFYRLPTYPFLLGANYLIAGKWAWASVTVMQASLDALTCCMAAAIALELELTALARNVVALLFVFNPFTLFWIPVQMPEVVGVFLVVGASYLAVRRGRRARHIAIAAAATVLGLWTKQYIAALLPALVLFLFASPGVRRPIAAVCSFFALVAVLYSPWVIRNYTHYGEVIVLTAKTTGARHYLADFAAAMDFYSLFHVNFNKQIMEVVNTGRTTLPPSPFVRANQSAIDKAATRAYECGPSFRAWRGETFMMDSDTLECEQEVAGLYRGLRELAHKEMPTVEFYRTGMLGLLKAATKYDLNLSERASLLQAPIFAMRCLLLALAFVSPFTARLRAQRLFAIGANIFWLSTAVVLAFALRHVEMRYLLMADSLMFISAAITVQWLMARRVTTMKEFDARSASSA